MKARLLLSALLVALSLVSATGQPQPGQTLPAAGFAPRIPNQPEPSKLTKFSLDFPGGRPQQLVAAIEKAMSKPLNVIIPAEQDMMLPPLKMNNVDVQQLFQALEFTGRKSEAYVSGIQPGSYQIMQTSYGFRTPGAQSDDSIWYFYVEKPVKPPQVAPVVQKTCRFYALTPYLERGLTVDDITTAITTGWKMLAESPSTIPSGFGGGGGGFGGGGVNRTMPALNFHKETNLLIAVGEPDKLETIDAVLKALSPTPAPGGAYSDRLNTIIQRVPAGGSSSAPANAAEPSTGASSIQRPERVKPPKSEN